MTSVSSSCLFVLFAAACTTEPTSITGPFTGPTQRFVVDRITLPTSNSRARELGVDLNGDGTVDNQLGMVMGTLTNFADTPAHAEDEVASGAIASSVEIQADDFDNAATVGVTYIGAPGAAAVAIGGAFVAGSLTSNPTDVSTGMASLVLPVFADADPSVLELDHITIELAPDGRGGYDARIQGVVPGDRALELAATGLTQMVMSNPLDHLIAAKDLDANHDGRVTADEVAHNTLVNSLLTPDVRVGSREWLSLGFAVHLTPCAAGSCIATAVTDTCHDRVRDGNESDVDCGGDSCQPCGDAGACAIGSDCFTGACDAGTCRSWSCSDGVKDGWEDDVDCGHQQQQSYEQELPACGRCGGDACNDNSDCASHSCVSYRCT